MKSLFAVSLYLLVLIAAGAVSAGENSPPHHGGAECGDPAAPLLSVADFDGSGLVDGSDIVQLAKTVAGGQYYAFYDRNADGVLDPNDIKLAAGDINKTSTNFDAELVEWFQRFGYLQTVTGVQQLLQLGYLPGTEALKGHGVHWLNQGGAMATQGLKPADKTDAEGLNVPSDNSRVSALFWGDPVLPLFNDPQAEGGLSPLDYPQPGGAWESERVQAFATHAPVFTSSPAEYWHPHAGLCVTIQDRGVGPETVLDQHTSFAECQAIPSLVPTGIVYPNAWMNFWMIHVWLYDLNPNGVFGGTHPCIDPDAISEDVANGGREIPPFFQQH